ncbi:hypothetical protein [Pseudomonas rustica]|uniref:hypothetical protein n=1 Tax=Pseudomonas rustica TaxID=2827099 RepID=UPI001BAE95A8|nr:hypothetical protein [Pseudomonas rustica]MBS4090409.1 hypothetical protein [Pseudomonas rustica]
MAYLFNSTGRQIQPSLFAALLYLSADPSHESTNLNLFSVAISCTRLTCMCSVFAVSLIVLPASASSRTFGAILFPLNAQAVMVRGGRQLRIAADAGGNLLGCVARPKELFNLLVQLGDDAVAWVLHWYADH